MRKTGILAIAMTVFFLSGPFGGQKPEKSNFEQMMRLPGQAFSNSQSPQACGLVGTEAWATFADHESKTSPAACDCTNISTIPQSWNKCLSCLIAQYMNIIATVSATFGAKIDPDTDSSVTVKVDGVNYVANSRRSLKRRRGTRRYDRRVTVARETGQVCLDVHFSKKDSDRAKVLGFLYLSTTNCPAIAALGNQKHVMTLLFDLFHTSDTVQTGDLLHVSEMDGDSFDITKSTTNDEVMHADLKVTTQSSGKKVTKAWVHRLSRNAAKKYFLHGINGEKVLVAQRTGISLTNTKKDGTDMTGSGVQECANDATDTALATASCTTDGFTAEPPPVAPDELRGMNMMECLTALMEAEGIPPDNLADALYMFAAGCSPK